MVRTQGSEQLGLTFVASAAAGSAAAAGAAAAAAAAAGCGLIFFFQRARIVTGGNNMAKNMSPPKSGPCSTDSPLASINRPVTTMGKTWPQINDYARDMIARQQLYFVATAPLTASGHINVSPKGHCPATFSILNSTQVAFLDLTGSGNETIAHVKENGRIVFMFCSFDESPCIIRLWGTGRVHENGTPGFYSYMSKAFGPDSPNGKAYSAHPGFSAGARSIIVADIYQVSTACGYGVPVMNFVAERDVLIKWSAEEGPEGMKQYQIKNNLESLDGLRGLNGSNSAASSLAASATAAALAALKDNGASLALLAAGAAVGAAVATAVARRH